MSTTTLFNYLESFHPLSEDLKRFLNEQLIYLSFPKGHILLDVAKVATHAYFLNDGFAMSYSFNREGRITENFWKPGQVIIAFESFFYQKPSLEVIELMKASDLLCISYETIEHILTRFPESHQLYRSMMNRQYLHVLKRVHMLKLNDLTQQYNKLLNTFPGLELIVTQKAIATYLGIAPQSLARIKRKSH